jgi:hypothetical protein
LQEIGAAAGLPVSSVSALRCSLAFEGLGGQLVQAIPAIIGSRRRNCHTNGIGKLKSLVAACREAGTWKSLISDAGRGVQITWQYILFEWNDSDEEIDLAKTTAAQIGVPIEWVITSGFGASRRFTTGSNAAKALMEPPYSFIHEAANADVAIEA